MRALWLVHSLLWSGWNQRLASTAYVERKLYTHNCAHAVLGYLGHIAGITYGYEA